uniref:general transcription factor IIE subunit 1 n=1 Tax=Myxine glutinosa TaxID=7769 RepID=UPI00358F2BD5
MSDSKPLTEIPAALKRLVKYIVRGFYAPEHALALDILIRNPCVKEEDMQELLKFDRKQLRSVLNTLKADKFVKCRLRVETAPDGKTTRHNYYFINYRLLVNVVKYKLDHMRRKIETDERDSTNRASFRCPTCSSTFTDLEANQLFEPESGSFHCTFCQTEVEEDETSLPKKDARTLVARFNEQIEPIYVLLRQADDLSLAHEILEPEPTDIPALRHLRSLGPGSSNATGNSLPGMMLEGWSSARPSYDNLYEQNVTISMEEVDGAPGASAAKPTKERPVWMHESTVHGGLGEAERVAPTFTGSEDVGEKSNNCISSDHDEVMRALLVHEKKAIGSAGPGGGPVAGGNAFTGRGAGLPAGAAAGAAASDSESDTTESSDDEDGQPPAKRRSTQQPRAPRVDAVGGGAPFGEEDDDFEEVSEEPTVTVAGRAYRYGEVSRQPELVSKMTAEEKEVYIQTGQQMFQDMYE